MNTSSTSILTFDDHETVVGLLVAAEEIITALMASSDVASAGSTVQTVLDPGAGLR